MAKKKTSGRQKGSLKTPLGVALGLERHDPAAGPLKDPKVVREVLIDALMQNDLDTFQDVLIAHLRVTSKSRLAARSGLGRQTLYDLISPEREFNPTLSTLGALLKAIAA
jgi:DNA-binding phage protein